MGKPYTRNVRSPRRAPLVVVSAILLGVAWVDWWFTRVALFAVPYPVFVGIALGANLVITARWAAGKRVAVAAVQRYLLNPPVRWLARLGVTVGCCLLETTGRRTGLRRVVPVGHGLVEGRFWIVAEHGTAAAYVRNIRADPRVRVRLRQGLTWRWRNGIAHVLPDDDPYARQRWLIGWTHPLRALNAMLVRVLGTDPVTVRIDLDLDVVEGPGPGPAAAVVAAGGGPCD